MNTDVLEIKAAMQVGKPTAEVFEAIVNPEHMTQYFISESTGTMEEGKELIWKWPEFDFRCPIRVGKIEKNRYISYYWPVDDMELLVEIKLEALNHDTITLVAITEKSHPNNEKGLKWLSGNSFGWSNFLACLKAYLEYGINLRKGSFDFMKK